MSTQNLQDNLNWLLIRSSTMAKQGLLRISEQYELTPLQLLTLCLLDPTDAVAMSAIADLLVCDPSNVTGIVDKLSGLG
jgi:DNA-binding MarR family transcriptional regulator